MTIIGLISPGKMGSSIGAAVSQPATRVIWAGEGRSEESQARASDAGLENCGTINTLVNDSDIILSGCPRRRSRSPAGDATRVLRSFC